MIQDNPLVKRAQDILRGEEADPADILKLAKLLKAEKLFGYARQLLFRARQSSSLVAGSELATLLRQQHALCTYKDQELPADSRMDRALAILGEGEDLSATKVQETLGLAGAIYKYKWETFGQRGDLDRSLSYYQRGYRQGIQNDDGYTAINAAYVLDVLANEEAKQQSGTNGDASSATLRFQESAKIRAEIVAALKPLSASAAKQPDWWFLVTLAEADFGLRNYSEASEWLQKARNLSGTEDWMFETTARQLACVARLHKVPFEYVGKDPNGPWGVLEAFLGNAAGVLTAYIGKVGLALSGGGFRAALFHIGVLARLAELDVLRHVEVLSCVSGGSIIGAHYYLELRNLLNNQTGEIKRQDYIDIVERLQREFLAGVQKNIRMRVLANPWANIRMLLFPNASRTERVAELYERHLFSRVKDGGENSPRWLDKLLIEPKDEAKGFNPKSGNWRRKIKVPILVLNATTLNTGHNWQFTASWMGEPPAGINSEIDGNYLFRRMEYGAAPLSYRHYRLGFAVAASSCVPGLFEPLSLPRLFPDKTVRLVDGGVHDNQGIGALLNQDCSVLLVSDASGQMEAQGEPGNSALSALLRSNSILQARVREAEFHELEARRKSSLLRGLMFIHLKKDLDVDPIDWIDCEDPFDASDEARPSARRGDLTCYGIRKNVQNLLAGIRTDLDSFHEVEAFALMTSGYRMTEYEFPRGVPNLPVCSDSPVAWHFLKVEEPMKRVSGVDAAHREIMTLLTVANSIAFKIWKLSAPLKWFGRVIIAMLVVAAGWACIHWANRPLITPKWIGITLLTFAATAVLGKTLVKVICFKDSLEQIGVGIGMGIFGWMAAGIHLLIFDPMYLRRGKLSQLDK